MYSFNVHDRVYVIFTATKVTTFPKIQCRNLRDADFVFGYIA